MNPNLNPKRGEIWMVNFDPQIGDEIKKERPAVVLNLPVEQMFQLRLVAPMTEWQPSFIGRITKVQVNPSPETDWQNRAPLTFCRFALCPRPVFVERWVIWMHPRFRRLSIVWRHL